MTGDEGQTMPCMEVWGGNQAEDRGVMMSGLDAWLYARPFRSEAGGDVHYVSSCATGRVTRMLVADVSGHGDSVAATGAKLRHLMRRYVNHLDQTRFVVALNDEFGALSTDGGFATSIVGTFFAPTNHLVLSSAGHPPPLHWRRAASRWSVVEAPESTGTNPADLPLGVLEKLTYTQQHLKLAVGDLVLFYTDALPESRSPDGRLLGTAGLLKVVSTLDTSLPDKLIAALLDAIRAMHEGNLEGDDVTVLLFRPNGLAPRVPLGRRVAAPFRVMAGVARSLLRRGEPAPLPDASLPGLGGLFFSRLNRRWGK